MISNRFDMKCTHEPNCTRWCFNRVYRQCKRLSEALLIVYEDSSVPQEKKLDRRKQYINNWRAHKENNNKQVSSVFIYYLLVFMYYRKGHRTRGVKVLQ